MTLRTLAEGAAARLRARDGATHDPPVGRPADQAAPGPVTRLSATRGSAAAPTIREMAGLHGWPALAGLGLGLLALGPGLGPGYLLSYDMVFVPRMPFSAALIGLTGGPPRAVPSDAVVAVASLAVPADILQKLILLAIFTVACSGAAALLASGWTAASGTGTPGTPATGTPATGTPATGTPATGTPATGTPGTGTPGTGGLGRAPLLARLAAGVCYAWNPYVAERLLIGQWALLLGYAGLPWVLRLLSTGPVRIRPVRLLGVMIPAAIGGFTAMAVTALAAVPAALARRTDDAGQRARRLAIVAACLVLLSLPWLIPAFAVPVHTDPRGVDAFAARADTPFGRVGSLLMLSGIWNAQTVPRGYGGAASAVWLLVVVAALGGYLLLARMRGVSRGLGIAALAGLAIALIGVVPPARAALRDLVAAWAGFAVLRDGQQFLAPLALAEAMGLGALVAWIAAAARRLASPAPAVAAATTAERQRCRYSNSRVPTMSWPEAPPSPAAPSRVPAAAPAASAPAASAPAASAPAASAPAARSPAAGARRATVALGVMAVLAPVVLLPGLAWGLAGRLRPVAYPADWARARQVIDGDPARGTVLLLPWAAYRRYPWNSGEAVYDPWSRLLGREVISNDALQVGNLVLSQESQDSIRLNRIVTAPGPLTRALRSAGVRYVIIDAGPLLTGPLTGPREDLAARARLPGAQLVMASRDLVVFRLPARLPARLPTRLPAPSGRRR